MSPTEMSGDAAVTLPEPILIADNYSTAPTMLADTQSIQQTTNTISLDINDNAKLELQEELKACSTLLVANTGDLLFYYIKPPPALFLNGEQQKEASKLLLLYNSLKKPLWQLNSRDWHGITLSLNTTQIVLSTSPPQFSFIYNKQICHWQVISPHPHEYSLQCYQTESKKLIAEIPKDSSKMIIIGNIQDTATINTTNPYRKSTQSNDIHQWIEDPFTTLVILTGLLIRDHVRILLKSLGDGPDALHMMVDPSFRPKHHSAPQALSDGDEEEEDDAISFASYNPSRHYPGHQSLVDDRGISTGRWSSTPSFKSIELDPGIWHCWWGYKFWWSWFPWCMPGGCCDRACIKLKGRTIKPKLSSTSRHLSKQGWQQQHY